MVELTAFAEMFEGAREKSHELGARYRAVAELHGIGFVDAGAHIHCSPLDGIHFEADQHAKLGRVMAAAVQRAARLSERAKRQKLQRFHAYKPRGALLSAGRVCNSARLRRAVPAASQLVRGLPR